MTRGSRPPPRFGSEYGEAAAPRRLAGGGRWRCGGGAAGQGRGLVVVVEVVDMVSDVEAPFIGRKERGVGGALVAGR